MDVFSFLAGLTLGLGLCWLKNYRSKRQLAQMVDSLAGGTAENSDLPLMSRMRQEIQRARETQQQFSDTVAMWRTILEVAPVGYLQVDEENQLLWCNEGARQLLKLNRWKPQELRLLIELVRSYELDRAIEQTRRRQQPQVQEWVFQAPPVASTGGASPAVALRAQTLPLEGGQVGVFLENRQPLVDLARSRDRTFSDLTHELRTPLTSIYLVAETLHSRLQGIERSWIERMLREIKRSIALIQSCLEVDRLEQNPQQQLHYESIPLKAFLFEIWQTLEPIASGKALKLDYAGDEALHLHGDRLRLSQVFLNLLDNSINYSPSQTTLQVTVQQTPAESIASCPEQRECKGWLVINVIDSGCGFQESDIPHVFERLYRGDPSRTRSLTGEHSDPLLRRGGNGLGLSIARDIVEAHGGSIAAQNHPKTGGAWLQIQLPDLV